MILRLLSGKEILSFGVPTHNYQSISIGQLPLAKIKLEIPDVTVLTNTYTFSNDVPLRSINVSTATLTDALNAIAAIVTDLKTAGIFPP